MPKQPMNYQNNIIYKIQHKTIDELIYIGSTTNFAKRKCSHKTACNNEKDKEYNQKKYMMIRENGGWDMFDMVLVKKYPCNDYLEAHAEEERIRREMNANMNAIRCFRTQEEKQEYIKKYNETHKQEISERKKKYDDTHKEEKKIYYETHKEEINERKKIYYETHKQEISERKKKYHETHKQTIHLKNKEKITCECGCILSRQALSVHKKTTKHLELISRKTT